MAALGYFMMLVDPESSLWRHLALPPASLSTSPSQPSSPALSPAPTNSSSTGGSDSSGSVGATAGIVVGVVAGVAGAAGLLLASHLLAACHHSRCIAQL